MFRAFPYARRLSWAVWPRVGIEAAILIRCNRCRYLINAVSWVTYCSWCRNLTVSHHSYPSTCPLQFLVISFHPTSRWSYPSYPALFDPHDHSSECTHHQWSIVTFIRPISLHLWKPLCVRACSVPLRMFPLRTALLVTRLGITVRPLLSTMVTNHHDGFRFLSWWFLSLTWVGVGSCLIRKGCRWRCWIPARFFIFRPLWWGRTWCRQTWHRIRRLFCWNWK